MGDKAQVEIQLHRKVISTVLTSPIPIHEEVHYQLHNSERKLAFSKSIVMVNANGTNKEQLDISALPAGSYELTITVAGDVLERKTVTI